MHILYKYVTKPSNTSYFSFMHFTSSTLAIHFNLSLSPLSFSISISSSLFKPCFSIPHSIFVSITLIKPFSISLLMITLNFYFNIFLKITPQTTFLTPPPSINLFFHPFPISHYLLCNLINKESLETFRDLS